MIQHHRTKIVGTLGPATDDPGLLRKCLTAGLDIARLNAAHGTDEEKKQRASALREAARALRLPVGLLIDLPGPKFRLGNLPGGQRQLRRGDFINLSPSGSTNTSDLPIRDTRILASLARGHMLHLADGTVTIRIVKAGSSVEGQVMIGGLVRSGSGINVPDTNVDIKIPTPADLRSIAFAASQAAEWIGVSFVRTPEDISRVRRACRRYHHYPRIIAKIEKPQGLANLEPILEEADGVMVARGDLGVETPLAQVPLAQKKIIAAANAMGKPVITATQMLESMVSHRWPTRAEVADVANAVLDGTDAVMLSAETAIGQYPAEAIQMLGSVLKATEEGSPFEPILDPHSHGSEASPEEALGSAACRLAWDTGAKAIVISSPSEVLPYSVSSFRPPMPIIVLSENDTFRRQLSLSWGIEPVAAKHPKPDSWEPARQWLLKNRVARRGDCVVILKSPGKSAKGMVNSIQVVAV